MCFSMEYAVFKAGGYTGDAVLVSKYRGCWLPVLTFPAIIIFIFCFAKMFYVMKTRMIRTAQQPDNHKRRFLIISILNLLGFIVCAAPLATLNVIDLALKIDPDHLMKIKPILQIFLIANPLVDSIGFLIVYRSKLRQRRPPLRRKMELRTIQKPSVKRLREVQIQDNSGPSNEEVSGIAIAVVTDCASPV